MENVLCVYKLVCVFTSELPLYVGMQRCAKIHHKGYG